MKLPGLEGIDAGTRSAIVIAVAVAYFAWDLGFELGVHGQVFIEKVFLVWSVSLALLIIFSIIPRKILPVPRSLWFATAIPTLWLLVGLANRAAPDEILIRHALTILGFIVVLGCFPYVAYVIISVIYPDFTRMQKIKPKIGIVVVFVTMAIVGYLIGASHYRFITCEDFEISGQFVPANCAER